MSKQEILLTDSAVEFLQEEVGGGTTVIANPTLAGTEADLTGLQVGETKYKVSQGGGGSDVHLYQHNITIDHYDNEQQIGYLANFKIFNSNPTTLTLQNVIDYLVDNGFDGIKDDWNSVKMYEVSGTYGDYSGTEEYSNIDGVHYKLDAGTNENVLVLNAKFADIEVDVENPRVFNDIVIQIL